MFATMRRKNRNAKMKSELTQSVDHFKRAATLAAQETSATVGPKFYAAKERVQPAATRAKDAASSGWGSAVSTLTPLVTAATDGAKQVSKKTAKASEKAAKANEKAAKANKKAAKSGKKNAKQLEKRANKALGRKQGGVGRKLAGFALAGAAVGVAGAYFVRKRRTEQWDEYDPAGSIAASTTGSDDAAFEPADLAGPSGFVTPVGETEPVIPTGDGDQTSSALHSPKVARLANGQNGN
ncbi:hypothetical protein [Actinoplanes sp. TFC3]|uniref:hypothetical protein n=1 Tax=Actinoplanes sp. TFC3 TaxID=1710355 RepID=UPI00082A6650|nr:hypothetical protein [Actinoplanes sp. TFC3]